MHFMSLWTYAVQRDKFMDDGLPMYITLFLFMQHSWSYTRGEYGAGARFRYRWSGAYYYLVFPICMFQYVFMPSCLCLLLVEYVYLAFLLLAPYS